jgi:hypothetical protein
MPRTVVIAEPNVPTRVGEFRVTVKLSRRNRVIVYIDHPELVVDNRNADTDNDDS